jgi:hypothetical protein
MKEAGTMSMFARNRKCVLALAVCSLVGCGGKAAEPGSESVPEAANRGASVIPPVSTVDAAGWASPNNTVRADRGPLCAADAGGVRTVQTDAEAVALLVGTWWVCASPSAFGTHEAGVAIFADGTWNKVYAGSSGVTLGQDHEDRGTWVLTGSTTTNGGTAWGVGMVLEGGGGNGFSVSFANSMLKMHVENMSFHRADYVRDDSVAPTQAPAVTYPAIDPAAICSAPAQGAIETPTREALVSAMVGQWMSCGGSAFCGDEVGVELTADGAYYKLYAAGAGRVRRGSSFGQSGQWSVTDLSAMYGPGALQVGLNDTTLGGIIVHPTFTASPRTMHLDNNGVCVADYVLNEP